MSVCYERMSIESNPLDHDRASPEARKLFSICFSQKPDLSEIINLMNDHFEQVKIAKQNGHPLLHEAVAQASYYEGARCILDVAWQNPNWRSLFNSQDYLGKYKDTVFMAMREKEPPRPHSLDVNLLAAWTMYRAQWKPIQKRPWE